MSGTATMGAGIAILALHLSATVVAFRAIRTARTPQGAVGWVLFLVLLPYGALPLYFFLGHSRIPGYVQARRSSKTVMAGLADFRRSHPPRFVTEGSAYEGFERMAGMPVVSGNAAKLLVDGDETFEAILSAVEAAQRYVLVQFYIVRDDEIGRALAERLMRKARAGCSVRLLYDAIGSYALPSTYLDRLRAAGVECANFHSIRQPHSRFQINFRNHRKIVVVDGEVGFVGGLNVGDEYLGRDPAFGHWRDTHLMLRGPAVAHLQLVFAEDWNYATHDLPQLDWQPQRQPEDTDVLILAPGPADEHETGRLYFCNAIGSARRRVWIASAYFVPDTDITSSLVLAALRGVDVRIIVPAQRDHLLVWLAAFAYFDEMLRAGVRVFRYTEGFMHQKVALIDDAFASVGSVNLDNRSCRLNFEVTALVFGEAFAAEVEAMLERDLARSTPYTTPLDQADSRLRRLGAPVARLLAPLL